MEIKAGKIFPQSSNPMWGYSVIIEDTEFVSMQLYTSSHLASMAMLKIINPKKD